jgi:mannitol 2-dehydrogenase
MTELMTRRGGATTLTQSAVDAGLGPIGVPGYDRSRLVPSIVHIGFGRFHRAHQAVYLDELGRLGNAQWGVVGVGVRRPDTGRALAAQDNLYTVVERGNDRATARVVGSVVKYLLLADQRDAVLRQLADPRTRLVTLTITGDGYATGSDSSQDSVFDVIVEALDMRRACGTAPFTVLSCDNLPDSGGAARRAVMAVARRRGQPIAQWIESRVSFPGAVVDRITLSMSPSDRDEVAEEFGIADRVPVITEPFRQWIIEDDFCNGRPPLELVGARFVEDVAPYKQAKSWLLNGSHTALGYIGSLAGCRTTHEAMQMPIIAAFVRALMGREVAPLLVPDLAGLDLGDYQQSLLRRFRNEAIGDRLERLCARGSTKMPSYVLPALHQARASRRPHRLLLVVVAAWMRYLCGTDLSGRAVLVTDARAEELQRRATTDGPDPRRLLSLRDIFGDLVDDESLVAELSDLVDQLDRGRLEDVLLSAMASDR